jgi:hypothetical protein
MPTFDTPQPIVVTVELAVGHLRIVASDRIDTVVEVRPTNSSRAGDVNAARQTRVEYADGRLLVKAPKGWRQFTPLGGNESVDIEIAAPSGSQLRGGAAVAEVRCIGSLGECHYKMGAGSIQLSQTGPVQLKTSVGDITVERVGGDAQLTTSSGAVRIDRIDGAAIVKNTNGDTWIGDVAGDLRVSAANGKIAVDRAQAAVVAKTANGDVRIDEVARGGIEVRTARGRIDVGVSDGVAAWLDLNTSFGSVRNSLEDAARPEVGDGTVEVRARTAFGDITINRSLAGNAPGNQR